MSNLKSTPILNGREERLRIARQGGFISQVTFDNVPRKHRKTVIRHNQLILRTEKKKK